MVEGGDQGGAWKQREEDLGGWTVAEIAEIATAGGAAARTASTYLCGRKAAAVRLSASQFTHVTEFLSRCQPAATQASQVTQGVSFISQGTGRRGQPDGVLGDVPGAEWGCSKGCIKGCSEGCSKGCSKGKGKGKGEGCSEGCSKGCSAESGPAAASGREAARLPSPSRILGSSLPAVLTTNGCHHLQGYWVPHSCTSSRYCTSPSRSPSSGRSSSGNQWPPTPRAYCMRGTVASKREQG